MERGPNGGDEQAAASLAADRIRYLLAELADWSRHGLVPEHTARSLARHYEGRLAAADPRAFADYLLTAALQSLERGDLPEARRLAERALVAMPDEAEPGALLERIRAYEVAHDQGREPALRKVEPPQSVRRDPERPIADGGQARREMPARLAETPARHPTTRSAPPERAPAADRREAESRHAAAVTALARQRLEAGDLDQALRLALEGCRFAPDHADAQAARAEVHEHRGDWASAEAAWAAAMRLEPSRADYAERHTTARGRRKASERSVLSAALETVGKTLGTFMEERNIQWLHLLGAAILVSGFMGVAAWVVTVRQLWGVVGRGVIVGLCGAFTAAFYCGAHRVRADLRVTATALLCIANFMLPLTLYVAKSLFPAAVPVAWPGYLALVSAISTTAYAAVLCEARSRTALAWVAVGGMATVWLLLKGPLRASPMVTAFCFAVTGTAYLAASGVLRRRGRADLAPVIEACAHIAMAGAVASALGLVGGRPTFGRPLDATHTLIVASAAYGMAAYLTGMARYVPVFCGSLLLVVAYVLRVQGVGLDRWHIYAVAAAALGSVLLSVEPAHVRPQDRGFAQSYRWFGAGLTGVAIIAFASRTIAASLAVVAPQGPESAWAASTAGVVATMYLISSRWVPGFGVLYAGLAAGAYASLLGLRLAGCPGHLLAPVAMAAAVSQGVVGRCLSHRGTPRLGGALLVFGAAEGSLATASALALWLNAIVGATGIAVQPWRVGCWLTVGMSTAAMALWAEWRRSQALRICTGATAGLWWALGAASLDEALPAITAATARNFGLAFLPLLGIAAAGVVYAERRGRSEWAQVAEALGAVTALGVLACQVTLVSRGLGAHWSAIASFVAVGGTAIIGAAWRRDRTVSATSLRAADAYTLLAFAAIAPAAFLGLDALGVPAPSVGLAVALIGGVGSSLAGAWLSGRGLDAWTRALNAGAISVFTAGAVWCYTDMSASPAYSGALALALGIAFVYTIPATEVALTAPPMLGIAAIVLAGSAFAHAGGIRPHDPASAWAAAGSAALLAGAFGPHAVRHDSRRAILAAAASLAEGLFVALSCLLARAPDTGALRLGSYAIGAALLVGAWTLLHAGRDRLAGPLFAFGHVVGTAAITWSAAELALDQGSRQQAVLVFALSASTFVCAVCARVLRTPAWVHAAAASFAGAWTLGVFVVAQRMGTGSPGPVAAISGIAWSSVLVCSAALGRSGPPPFWRTPALSAGLLWSAACAVWVFASPEWPPLWQLGLVTAASVVLAAGTVVRREALPGGLGCGAVVLIAVRAAPEAAALTGVATPDVAWTLGACLILVAGEMAVAACVLRSVFAAGLAALVSAWACAVPLTATVSVIWVGVGLSLWSAALIIVAHRLTRAGWADVAHSPQWVAYLVGVSSAGVALAASYEGDAGVRLTAALTMLILAVQWCGDAWSARLPQSVYAACAAAACSWFLAWSVPLDGLAERNYGLVGAPLAALFLLAADILRRRGLADHSRPAAVVAALLSVACALSQIQYYAWSGYRDSVAAALLALALGYGALAWYSGRAESPWRVLGQPHDTALLTYATCACFAAGLACVRVPTHLFGLVRAAGPTLAACLAAVWLALAHWLPGRRGSPWSVPLEASAAALAVVGASWQIADGADALGSHSIGILAASLILACPRPEPRICGTPPMAAVGASIALLSLVVPAATAGAHPARQDWPLLIAPFAVAFMGTLRWPVPRGSESPGPRPADTAAPRSGFVLFAALACGSLLWDGALDVGASAAPAFVTAALGLAACAIGSQRAAVACQVAAWGFVNALVGAASYWSALSATHLLVGTPAPSAHFGAALLPCAVLLVVSEACSGTRDESVLLRPVGSTGLAVSLVGVAVGYGLLADRPTEAAWVLGAYAAAYTGMCAVFRSSLAGYLAVSALAGAWLHTSWHAVPGGHEGPRAGLSLSGLGAVMAGIGVALYRPGRWTLDLGRVCGYGGALLAAAGGAVALAGTPTAQHLGGLSAAALLLCTGAHSLMAVRTRRIGFVHTGFVSGLAALYLVLYGRLGMRAEDAPSVYALPIGAYLISLPWLSTRAGKPVRAAPLYSAGLLLVLGTGMAAIVRHGWNTWFGHITLAESVLAFVYGLSRRSRSFFLFGGGFSLAWAGLLAHSTVSQQTGGWLLGVSVAAVLVGGSLTAWASFSERRRHAIVGAVRDRVTAMMGWGP